MRRRELLEAMSAIQDQAHVLATVVRFRVDVDDVRQDLLQRSMDIERLARYLQGRLAKRRRETGCGAGG